MDWRMGREDSAPMAPRASAHSCRTIVLSVLSDNIFSSTAHAFQYILCDFFIFGRGGGRERIDKLSRLKKAKHKQHSLPPPLDTKLKS
mmetsp:Transcript_36235/g.47951  ORF Transcript_36235/g.47951 Transcript_36235/m.47951 type:complete len:88 (-) Transcript_36235:436-699(-)